MNTIKVARPSEGNPSYMEAEVFAGAIWPRALSASEIAAITTYYQNKAA